VNIKRGNMKKIILSIITLVLAVVLVGCGHTHEYTETVTAPTCTENGFTTFTCECGDTYKDKEVSATGHKYGEWTVTKEATEKEKGSKEKVCSGCNDKVTEEIPMLEHTHKYTETVVEATCTENGYTQYTCECGDTYKDKEVAAAHKEEVIPGKEATCTETGLTEGKKCSVCNEVLVEQSATPMIAHTFGEWVVVKEASYVETGVKEKTCSGCNEKMTEEIPTLADPNEGKPVSKITIGSNTYASLKDALNAAKECLESMGVSEFLTCEVTLVPNDYVTLEGEDLEKFNQLLDVLEELEDVQNVYHNVKL
jgi:hypothetical protein